MLYLISNSIVPFNIGSFYIWLAPLMILNSPNNNAINGIIIVRILGWIINIVSFTLKETFYPCL